MINLKSAIITVSFAVGTVAMVTSAIGIKRGDDSASNLLDVEIVEESILEKMNYFSLDQGRKVVSLSADSLRIVGQRDLYFTAPDGLLYNENGDKIAYKAREGEFKNKRKELALDGDVKLSSPEGNYSAQNLYYNGSKGFLEARGNVQANVVDKTTNDQLRITSNYMNSWMKEERSLFIGDVKGKLSRKRAYEGSFTFSSEKMELNRLKSLVTLNKNVSLDRNNYHLEAQKAEIFLENYNKKLKYYVLYDDIKLVEELKLPSGASQTRRAFSEKLEGFMSQGKVVLTGAPSVQQGDDLIKGYQITLRENVELVEVEEAQSSFKLRQDEE